MIIVNKNPSIQQQNSELLNQVNTLKEYNSFLESLQKKSLSVIIDKDSLIKAVFSSDHFRDLKLNLKENNRFDRLITDKKDKEIFRDRLNHSIKENTETVFEISTRDIGKTIINITPGYENDRLLLSIVQNTDDKYIGELPEDVNYKQIAENAPDAILIGNNKGKIIGANSRFSQLSEYNLEEIGGKHISVILSENSVNKKPLRFDLLDSGQSIISERQLRTKSGKEIDIEMHSRRIDKFRYVSVMRDSTERIAMQKELNKNKERYDKLFDNSPLGILYCNREGKIVQINRAFLKILEFSSEEEAKKINLLRFQPLVNNGFSDMLHESLKSGNRNRAEYKYKARDHSGKHLKTFCIPLQNKEYQGAFIIAENISEQKDFIAKLKKAKEKAQESERLKSAFLANISHEIRTPLNAVLGFAQLFDCNEYSNEELMRFKSSIIKGSNTLLSLIDGIIKLSELQSGEIAINKEKIHVDFLMKQLTEYGKNEIKNVNKDIQLLYEYASLQKSIYTDETLLIRVMKHLINNAVKFTDSGFIKISFYNKNKRIFFSVQDSGIGISDRQKKYIFDKFRQAESPEAEMYRGVGMGLALSKEIINKLNGKITVHSEIGVGSTFEVELPVE